MADSTDDRAKIQEEIKAQGTIVRQLKAEKAPKEKVWITGFFCTGRKVFACTVQHIFCLELVSYVYNLDKSGSRLFQLA